MQKRIREHIRSNVVGYVALFCFAMGGTAYATHPGGANTISSGDIINGEVKSGDIGDLEIKAADIAADSLGSGKIANQSVKNADLGIGASSSNTIADGGIQGVDVKTNTLTGLQVDEATLFNDNSLTGADIDESTLSGVPSEPTGPAGGDLDGTYPNPTVANVWKLDGTAGTTAADFLGTSDNQPLNLRVNDARALRLEPASDGTNQSPNLIGGSPDNAVSTGVHSATIAGGGRSDPNEPATANQVTDNNGTVSGGANNRAGNGGSPSDAPSATVGGGYLNVAGHHAATVGGGFVNRAMGELSTVGGGQVNFATGDWATVPGGIDNTALGPFSFAAGSSAQANHAGAFVWADSHALDFPSTAPDQFSVRATGGTRLVSGIDGSGAPTSGLELPADTTGLSTLVNGEDFDVSVNGARGLRIDPATDGTNQSPNVIAGTAANQVTDVVHSATIGGGGRSDPADPTTANRVTDHSGTVGGGAGNRAGDDDANSADAAVATVGGGQDNTASGRAATVGGGQLNRAPERHATVGGGINNVASGVWATVPGGHSNVAAGETSLAAGLGARANHPGSFVWGDTSTGFMDSTANNQFVARAAGHFFLQSDSTLDDQGGFINTSTGGFLSSGGAWTNASDENLKTGFEDLDPREVLEQVESLPVRSWSYTAEPAVRHIGPVAQDFYRAFGVGSDNKHIASVDADGVALAAIKGLNEKVERLQHQVASLKEQEESR